MSGGGEGSFFAGAWRNHRFPDAVINGTSGALPPKDLGGLAHGFNAQTDAKINYNSTLLGDLRPYAGPKGGSVHSQMSYLTIPHKLQKVVPILTIPVAQWPGNATTSLYHAVDDGDVAFTISIDRNSTKYAESMRIFDKAGALRAIDPFCNLATVNYLLAGIQLYSDIPQATAWTQFIRDIGMYDDRVQQKRIAYSWQILKMIRDKFIPFGVPRGSDMQVRFRVSGRGRFSLGLLTPRKKTGRPDTGDKQAGCRPHRPRHLHALGWCVYEHWNARFENELIHPV
jgi:hypothetical protein